LAEEGALPPEMVADAAAGRTRLRGHALPDTLVAHLGETAAGGLNWRRSVRVASHPALRRLGIATRLTECIHATLAPKHIDTSQHIDGPLVAETPQPIDAARHMDAMGTLFGASAEVVRFRQRLGYQVVRLSASRGSRTGEPSVCMVRPFSPAAEALVARLRARFARDLPLQIELLQADVSPPLDPDLVQALCTDLPPSVPLTAAEAEAGTRTYAFGPGTFEAEAVAVNQWVETHTRHLDALPPEYRGVVEARVIDRRGWVEAMNRSGLPSHGAVMRALRRAIRAMLAAD
jgi:tRNA(Met) cytidine acetyltransferase